LDENLVPKIVRIEEIRQETPDIRTLRLAFEDPGFQNSFDFLPGQFCLISVFGAGESVFCIASPPIWKEFFEVSVKEVGKVTTAIHDLEVGDRLGFRGPYGNHFPYEANFGRDIVFVGGGIGLAPLRPLIWQTLADRARFGRVYIIYGARSVNDLVYRQDLETWGGRDDVKLVTAVDPGGEDETWKGEVGLVPQILERVGPPSDAVLVTCGPPIMIKFVFISAGKLGFKPEDVVTTLEMKMKCGVGTCGRCNIGNRYVCRHGPVFTLEQMQELPNEF
jgi:sulfhydrogenase subunit gamma (sulfur reductase)